MGVRATSHVDPFRRERPVNRGLASVRAVADFDQSESSIRVHHIGDVGAADRSATGHILRSLRRADEALGRLEF